MGLRDRLKAKLRAVLGKGAAPSAPAAAGDAGSTPRPPSAPTSSAAAPAPSAPAPSAPAPRPPAPSAPDESFQPVAASSQVAEGKAGTFPLADGTIVAIFRRKGQLYCMDNACAHEDGPVGEGTITDCKVRCPYHDWEYDFTTGACLTDPERRQTTWKVREQDGKLWVGPKLTEGTGARGGEHNDGLKVIVR